MTDSHSHEIFKPASPAEAALAAELAFGDESGPALVIGAPSPAIMAGLLASASSLTMVASARAVREARRQFGDLAPARISAARVDGNGRPVFSESFRIALIAELPKHEPLEILEQALLSVADEGSVWCHLERGQGPEARIEKLFAAATGQTTLVPAWASADRLVLHGQRRAPLQTAEASEAPGVLPLSVIVVARGPASGIEELLCDVLLKQHWPPREVFVLDLSRSDGPSLPPDLFGFAEQSASKLVLLQNPEEDTAAAINDALGGIEGDYVAILSEHDRIAPNHLAALGLFLENHPELGAVRSETVEWDSRNQPGWRSRPTAELLHPVRSLMAGHSLAPASVLYRTTTLRTLRGFDPTLTALHHQDTWLRTVEKFPVGHLPLPVAGVRRPRSVASDRSARGEVAWGQIWSGFRGRVSLTALVREFPEFDKRDRPSAALVARGQALVQGNRLEEAEADFRAALAASPGLMTAEEGLLLLLRKRGKHTEALRESERLSARAPKDPIWHLACANAFFGLGRGDQALQRLDGLLAGFPELEVAHLNRLAILLHDDPRGEAALRAYVARRPLSRSVPYFDHLLVAPRLTADETLG